MAKTVFILGAGASYSTGAPLMPEFLDVAHDLLDTRPNEVSRPAFEIVFELVNSRLPILHARSAITLRNLEAVFNLVEMGRLIGRLPATPPEEVEAVASALRTVLTETIESKCLFPHQDGSWLPHDDYGRLAAALTEPPNVRFPTPVAFLTFNYDVALDFALYWNRFELDYGLAPPRLGKPPVPLLKLHGSLNWATCSRCGHVIPLPFDRFFTQWPSPSRKIRDPLPFRVSSRLRMLDNHCAGAPISPEPAIVPPSWNKTQYHGAFGAVWKRAASEIAEATHIYVIGYSLPATDSFFRELLALGLAGPARLQKFTVVNIKEEVCTRFKELLGPDIADRFVPSDKPFSQYLDEIIAPSPRPH